VTRTIHPDGTVTLWCSDCGGVAHPATAVLLTERWILCGPCRRDSSRWLAGRLNGKPKRGRANFFEHVPAPK
jgi:hypothetical protein